jgi:SAM-dependent methyltransferase
MPVAPEGSLHGWLDRLRLRHPYPLLLERFADIPRSQRRSFRILDLPTGNGVLAIPLAAAGFDVVACDLFPETLAASLERFRHRSVLEAFEALSRTRISTRLAERLFPQGEPGVAGGLQPVPADMEERLPFSDGEFDAVLCIEGIEHVNNRHLLLSELRRVLRPDGFLILTTPNLLSVRARLAACLAGQRAFQSYLDEYTDLWGRSPDGRRVFHGHAFLVNYFQLRYSLYHCGLRIRRLLPSNWSPTSVLLWPFLYPWVSLFTHLAQRRAKRQFRRLLASGALPPDTPSPYSEMLAHVLSPECLLNSILVIEAIPAGPAVVPPRERESHRCASSLEVALC